MVFTEATPFPDPIKIISSYIFNVSIEISFLIIFLIFVSINFLIQKLKKLQKKILWLIL